VILAVLGHAGHHLNRPWPWLAWARESVYPWYLLHQTLIVAALVWLVPLRLGPVLEPVAVLGFTVAGCWLLTDGAVRRLRWLRPLFGLGPAPRAARATQTPRPPRLRPARPGTRAGAPPPSTRR
jgi:glucan biosynthesis protein C